MKKYQFIFILILIIVLAKINAGFEKKHNGNSVFEEKKVKKDIGDLSLIDEISRITVDLFSF